MPESPRWLASTGRVKKADAVVSMLENEALKAGATLSEPVVRPVDLKATARSDWRELFEGIYRKRTFTVWLLWIWVYVFTVFEAVALIGSLIPIVFAIETKGRVLEELSP